MNELRMLGPVLKGVDVSKKQKNWWEFTGKSAKGLPTGQFRATGYEGVGRLYYPLCNEAQMLSSVTPQLQGGAASGHNSFLGLPLSAEDLPHTLAHRDFWLAEKGRVPFSLSGCSPEGLLGHLGMANPDDSVIEAGPGWFSLERKDVAGRFVVKATLWCPSDLNEKVESMLVEVTNTSKRKLTLHPYAAIPLYARSADNLRDHRHVSALLHRTKISTHGVAVQPTMTFDERGHQFNACTYSVQAFGPRGIAPSGIWPTQESFLGDGGNFAAPSAVWNMEEAPLLTATERNGKEAIGGFRFRSLSLAPGKTASFVVLSGISEKSGAIRKWSRKLGQVSAAKKSLKKTKAHWLQSIQSVVFQTGDKALDNWLVWVGYQPMLRRLYGNSFLPEFDYGRGGKGWRDLWQDCLALLLYEPEPVREMLLHNFGGVRIDGSNATIIGQNGEFIADRNNIPRTWMDHGSWPMHTALLYVDQTGDLDFLLEQREYFRDLQLCRCRRKDAQWTEAYGQALRTRQGKVYKGSLLEHMLIQNITAFFNVGDHNICKLEGADWNDGLDMAEDLGESVAFSAFYAWNLERLAGIVEQLAAVGHKTIKLVAELGLLLDRAAGRGRVNYASAKAKQGRLQKYLDEVSRDISGRTTAFKAEALAKDLMDKSRDLKKRIASQEWVSLSRGEQCFNGYYDNQGKRVAGRRRGTTRMTLTGQVFPLMAGVASEEQVDEVVAAVRNELWAEGKGGVRLNTDFGALQPDLGRAFSFNYGEKENGAVFSHMAVMYSCALYQRRRAKEGRAVWHALYDMAMNTEVARIFPCIPEYFNAEGRGMYCYLTGSASWLVYLLLTQVFGVRGEWGHLVLDPQLEKKDFVDGKASVATTFGGRRLLIEYRNEKKRAADQYLVENVTLGGCPVATRIRDAGGVVVDRKVIASLPLNKQHRLVVELA